jgi:hypothetical protein
MLLNSDTPHPEVLLVDSKDGALQASISLGYQPMPAWRRSADELLVSNNEDLGDAARGSMFSPRLLVFDLANGLRLKRTILLPNRSNYTVPFVALWLSLDERYAFYSTHEQQSSCRSGGDSEICDKLSIGIIDLQGVTPRPSFIELPRGCRPAISSLGAVGLLVNCGHATYYIDPGKPGPRLAAESGTPPWETDPGIARNRAVPLVRLSGSSGPTGVLYSEGSYVDLPSGRSVAAVPAGKLPKWAFAMEGQRIVGGYVSRYYDQQAEGLAVFDANTGRIERTPRQ